MHRLPLGSQDRPPCRKVWKTRPNRSSIAAFLTLWQPSRAWRGRQFSNSYEDLSPSARELALAIDEYKLRHRRRFITYQEMLDAIEALGYHK